MAQNGTPSSSKEILGQLQMLAVSIEENMQGKVEDRTALQQAANRIVAALQTPEDLIKQTAFGPGYSMCVRIAIDLGLFDHISKHPTPISARELTSLTNADRTLIVRIMRVLTNLNYCNEDDEELYSANFNTHAMTEKGKKAAVIHFFDQAMPSYAKCPEFLRSTGFQSPTDPQFGPYQHAFGIKTATYDFWVRNKAIIDNFDIFMNHAKLGNQRNWTTWFPAQEAILDGAMDDRALLVDVGGARGFYLDSFRKKYPDAKGRLILEDLPQVIDKIEELDPRIERIKHDYNDAQPIKGARVYFFQGILHNNSDAICRGILRQIAAVMQEGYSKVLISEVSLPDRNCPLHAAGLDLGMMALHSGMERSERQWTELLDSVGMKLTRVWRDRYGDGSVVEGQLKGGEEI